MTAKLITAAAFVLIAVSCAQAQTVRIPVRCTVPSIPGVNAALVETSSPGSEEYVSTAAQQKETAAGKKVVKTYYVR